MGQDQKSQIHQISSIPITKNLFEFLYIIGRGGFGKVWKVLYKKTQNKYALKEMSKVKIIDRKSEKSIKNEKDFLTQLNYPFLVNMICSFQDTDNLYLVMDLFQGGDLRYHLCLKKKFTEIETKFFISCLLLSLKYIHSKNIIHRDIKPENLVLDSSGYLALTDFGVASRKTRDNSSETSGTPGYMAPEVLCGQNHSFPVDFFAIGIICYEFMTGKRPYLGRNRKEIKEAVFSKQAHIHRKDAIELGWSIESCDFINRMMMRKPGKRLGYNGIFEVIKHKWFEGVFWNEIEEKKIKAPFIPRNGDNFDRRYCEKVDKIDTCTRERYLGYKEKEMYKEIFLNYTFVREDLLPDNYFDDNKGKKNRNSNCNNVTGDNTTLSTKSTGYNTGLKGKNSEESCFNYIPIVNYLNSRKKISNNVNYNNSNIPNSSHYEILYKENQEKNSKDNIIYSRPHNLHHSKSLCYNNNSSRDNIVNKNNSKLIDNCKTKLQSPIYSYSRPISKIASYNSSANFNENYKNVIKKAIYSYNNSNFQKSLVDKNISINSTRNKNNSSITDNKFEIPSSRYSKINLKEKKIPFLTKNPSMKLFQFNSSYLRNIRDENNFKNRSRIGSTGHINFDINISRERPFSGIPSYRNINGVSPH